MLVAGRSSETPSCYVQELQRLHKCSVAEAAVLCASTSSTIAYPRHMSLSNVTNLCKHDVASCPITRVAQDSFYAARGVSYIPSSGKATVQWLLESEEKELFAAALGQRAVCNSLAARATAVTVLVSANCKYNVQLLDAIAHLASSRCCSTMDVVCDSTLNCGNGLKASAVWEAARFARFGFLVGPDADAYLKARRDAFEATNSKVPVIGEYGALLVVTYGTKISCTDVHMHAISDDLSECCSRSSNTDLLSNEIQRVVANIFSNANLNPQSELFQPLPSCTATPFMDCVSSIHREFFSILQATPEARRSSEAGEASPLKKLRQTDVYVRFVPKSIQCQNPVTAQTCFHGMLLCYPDKLEDMYEFLRGARQADRNPLYGIAAPNDSRQEAIGIHVMVIQAHSVALDDNITSYGLLGSPGKRLHRDGNYVMRTYKQLLAITPQILEQHFLLPCTFQSCIPLKEEVGYAFFGALDDCYATFAEHFGGIKSEARKSSPIERPSAWKFEEQGSEEAALARAIGLGFGSPAMRIGQLVAHVQSFDDKKHGCPDSLVAMLMSSLSSLGPRATVFEAFGMVKDIVEKRDKRVNEAEEKILSLQEEVKDLKAVVESKRKRTEEEASASSSLCKDTSVPSPLSLSVTARNRLMSALGLQKGSGGVIIKAPVNTNGGTESVASKLTKLVSAALKLHNVDRNVLDACKTACTSVGEEGGTQLRIETVARAIVGMSTQTELYVAVIGTAVGTTDCSTQSETRTTFHHVSRDGGVRQVSLCTVMETAFLGMVVLNHMKDRDECCWYKMGE